MIDDLDEPDTAPPVDHRYFLAIAPSSTHVCTSARVRVGQPPAAGATVVLSSSTIHRDEDMLVGFGGLAISGGALNVFAGFSGPAALGYPPPTRQSVAGSASDWHVARIELDAAGDGTWSASFAIDGRVELQNVAAFPKTGAIGYGEVGFGPVLVPPAPQPAPPPVVVDYADVRYSQR